MQSKEFYEAANALYNRNDKLTEAECRSIVHLAYYSVYHTCRAALGIAEEAKHITHRSMRDRILSNQKKSPILLRAARLYTDLLTLRIDADYNLRRIFSADDADDALDRAQDILGV